MPIGNWNLQWLNHNSQRSYPLTERATKQDINNVITIPDSFIVGMYFPIHAGTTFTPNGFYVSSLLISPTGFNIIIGYTSDPANPNATNTITQVAAANIARANYTQNTAYALAGINEFYDSVGYVVLGNLDEIDKQPSGLYNFNFSGGEIETDVIRPMLRSVSSLRVSNNGEFSDRIYGHVTLLAGDNIRFDVSSSGSETYITINAVNNENLNQTCLCDVVDTGDCIRLINGIPATNGNFVLAQNSCLSATEISGRSGLQLEDTCAQPCCGCSELDALRDQVNRFGDGITTLQNFVTRLGSEVTQMSLVVLGSRLNSSPCQQGQ
jgi:hypothetical protein